MNCYETLFIIKPTLTSEEIEGQITKVKDIISQRGGELKATNDMGMRRLAYPIEKQERGYYSVVYYTAPSQLLEELERQLRYNEDILRFMSVKYTSKKELSVFNKTVETINKKSAVEDTKASDETASETSEA